MRLLEQYKKLHEDGRFPGMSILPYVPEIADLIAEFKSRSLLDYGCGRGRQYLHERIHRAMGVDMPALYDPAVAEFSIKPRGPFEGVICFPAGTLVSGSGAIETIVSGCTTINSRGRVQKVRKTFKHIYTGDIVRLRVACVPDVLVTPEHPILVSSLRRVHRGNKTADKKAAYEFVASAPVWKAAKNVASRDWVSIPRQTEVKTATLDFYGGRGKQPHNIALDEGLGWLLGLYVAEGYTYYSGGKTKSRHGIIYLALSAKERQLAERAVLEFKRLGVNAWISQSPSAKKMNGLRVLAASLGLGGILDVWCGKGAGAKRVPEAIVWAEERIVRSFILGLVAGDGCIRKDRRTGREYYSVTTISKQLAIELLGLLHRIGVHGSTSNQMPNRKLFQGRKINSKDVYVVQWSTRAWDGQNSGKSGKIPYGRGRFIGDKVYLPVEKVSREKVSDLAVFNINTDDETYGVPYTVHNCTDVLEHVPEDELSEVIGDLSRYARQWAFITVCCRPSRYFTFDDGTNVHVTVKPFEWWAARLKGKLRPKVRLVLRESP